MSCCELTRDGPFAGGCLICRFITSNYIQLHKNLKISINDQSQFYANTRQNISQHMSKRIWLKLWQQKWIHTWGLDTGCLEVGFPLRDSWTSLLRSKVCFGIDCCDFDCCGLCITGTGFFALGGIVLFSKELLGVLCGKLFCIWGLDIWGRPGPVPLLLPFGLRQSIDVGLLAEDKLWGPLDSLGFICLSEGTALDSWRELITLLPLLLDNSLLFTGSWADLDSSISPKNLYKFPQ